MNSWMRERKTCCGDHDINSPGHRTKGVYNRRAGEREIDLSHDDRGYLFIDNNQDPAGHECFLFFAPPPVCTAADGTFISLPYGLASLTEEHRPRTEELLCGA